MVYIVQHETRTESVLALSNPTIAASIFLIDFVICVYCRMPIVLNRSGF
ncbi:hypothetical protein AB7321_19320 [Providencia rettgeri]|nr:hypothetical protein [Providencia rettgeri]